MKATNVMIKQRGVRLQTLFSLLLVLACVVFSSEVLAVAWNELNDAQKSMLQPFKENWENLPENKRSRLLVAVERWQHMTPEP